MMRTPHRGGALLAVGLGSLVLVAGACGGTSPGHSSTNTDAPTTAAPPATAAPSTPPTTSAPTTTTAPTTTAPTTTAPPASSTHTQLSSAFKAATAPGSESLTMDLRIGGLPSGQKVTILIAGDFSQKKEEGEFHLSGQSAAKAVSGEELLVDGHIYLKLNGTATAKPWVEQSAPSGYSASTSNPTQQLGILASGTGNVIPVGPATVDGVKTVEYKTVIDPATAASTAGLTSSEKSALQNLSQNGITSIPVEFWVDQQGHLRQAVENITDPGTDSGTGSPVDITVQFDLSDFGVAVKVTPPPASEVTQSTGTPSSD